MLKKLRNSLLKNKLFVLPIILLATMAFAFFAVTIASLLVKNNTKDFIASCAGLKEVTQTKQCVTQWFKNHGEGQTLQDAMDIINARFDNNRISLGSCHIWKHYATDAFLTLSWINLDFGIAACKEDNLRCDGGCLHTVIEETIVKNGLSQEQIDHIAQLCLDSEDKKSIAECIHGIGHGLGRLMNTDFNLLSALQYCDTVTNEDTLLEKCYTGVFNVTTLEGRVNKDGYHGRYFKSSDPSYPCESLPEKYRTACYHSLPDRVYIAGGSIQDAFNKCLEINPEKYSRLCKATTYKSIVTSEGMTPEIQRKSCLDLGQYASECIAGVIAQIVAIKGQNSSELSLFCSGLTKDQAQACLSVQ